MKTRLALVRIGYHSGEFVLPAHHLDFDHDNMAYQTGKKDAKM